MSERTPNRYFSLFLSCALCCGLFAVPGSANARDLKETVTRAVLTHPDIKAGRAAHDGLEQTAKEYYSDFFPVFGAEAGLSAMNVDNDKTRAATGGDASGYAGEGTLRVTQMIYDGKNTSNSYRAARERMDAVDFDVKSRVLDIAVTAVRAHLNVLRAATLDRLTGDYIADIGDYEQRIRDLVDAGAADEGELLQAKEILALARNAQLDYQERTELAIAEYLQVAGEWPDSILEISGTDKQAATMIPASVDEALAVLARRHPLLTSIEKNITALDYELKAQKGELLPRVDAELSYFQKEQEEEFGGEIEDASAMLRLRWNFAAGGAQKARIEKRRQARQEATQRARTTERDVERKLRQSYSRYQVAQQRLTLAAQRKQTNEGILENYRNQFEGGKRTVLQLLHARNQNYQANAAHLQATYGVYLAQYDLLNAMGILSDALGVGAIEAATLAQQDNTR